MEDYLEAIAAIEKRKKVVRVKDIAKFLQVKMPSVSGALKGLVKKNLVNHESYEYVELTSQGRQIAKEVKRKHEILRRFLVEILGLDEKMAQTEACNMEHTIGKQALERLVKFVKFVEACSGGGPACLKRFRHAVETRDFNIVCPFSTENIVDSKTISNTFGAS
jgi:DtxR family Mn-dependent transcriptional regulator